MFNKLLLLLLLICTTNAQQYLACGRDECLNDKNCDTNRGYKCTFCVENDIWKRTCTHYNNTINTITTHTATKTTTNIITSTATVTNNLSEDKNIFDEKMIFIITENSIIFIIIIIIVVLKLCGCINKNKNKLDIYEKRINMLENQNRELKSQKYDHE